MTTFKYPEGATPIDPNETEGLLLTHITTREELDRWEQDNILEALVWLDKTKPTDILNEQFIRELHKRMFRNVWKWAGNGKVRPTRGTTNLFLSLLDRRQTSNRVAGGFFPKAPAPHTVLPSLPSNEVGTPEG
jgi:fido (protein-threonine AMPylation protein)